MNFGMILREIESQENNMDKRDRADLLLDHVANYLIDNNWIINHYTLYWTDPIMNVPYHTMTALNVQLDRDLGADESQTRKIRYQSLDTLHKNTYE